MVRLKRAPSTLPIAATFVARVPPKVADAVYQTPEHRAWRAKVIARAGGVCQSPECDRKEPRMFADHIVEVKDGGELLDPANGQCLCGSCHSLKTAAERGRRARGDGRGG